MTRTARLAEWAAALQYDDIPAPVVERTKDLFLDTLGCAIAGRHHASVTAIDAFVDIMGPATGNSEVLHRPGRNTSAAFAALINGAASHVVEQDDLHNKSVVHPATVIFPAALAVAQDINANGKDFIVACVVGYDVACRVGEYLGRTHYQKFHTTATAGVLGVAAATSRLLKLDANDMLSSFGTAGTQAAGLWQYLRDATYSKQVHTSKACFDGIFAAYVAKHGLLGPSDILEGESGMGAALVPGVPNSSAIDEDLGKKFSVIESSFKWHASCRHTHPSVDALLILLEKHNISFKDITKVVCKTYRAAIDVLSLSEKAETVHQSKFSMGFVLAVAAKNRRATVMDFTEESLKDPDLQAFQKLVSLELDPEIDAKFPKSWQGTVIVTLKSGETFSETATVVKGDPELTLTRDEIEKKVKVLAEYGKIADKEAVGRHISRVWSLEQQQNMRGFACL